MKAARKTDVASQRLAFCRQLISVVLLLSLLGMTCFAWFIMNRKNQSDSPQVEAVEVSSVSANLFEVIGGTEYPVTKVNINNYIPGETRSYRAEFINGSGQDKVLTMSLRNFTAVLSAEDEASGIDGNLVICNKIEVPAESVHAFDDTDSQNISGTFNSGILSQMTEDVTTVDGVTQLTEGASVQLARTVLIPSGHTVSLYFSFRFREDASVAYMNMGCCINELATTFV